MFERYCSYSRAERNPSGLHRKASPLSAHNAPQGLKSAKYPRSYPWDRICHLCTICMRRRKRWNGRLDKEDLLGYCFINLWPTISQRKKKLILSATNSDLCSICYICITPTPPRKGAMLSVVVNHVQRPSTTSEFSPDLYWTTIFSDASSCGLIYAMITLPAVVGLLYNRVQMDMDRKSTRTNEGSPLKLTWELSLWMSLVTGDAAVFNLPINHVSHLILRVAVFSMMSAYFPGARELQPRRW